MRGKGRLPAGGGAAVARRWRAVERGEQREITRVSRERKGERETHSSNWQKLNWLVGLFYF
jgi:hypothetical protein